MRAVLFSLVVLYVTNVFAQKLDVQPQPLTAKSSVFSQVQPPVIAPIADVKELPQSWFSAPVTHGEGMFNPIFLPFTYKTEGVPGDPNQPWTFPALLHHKFAFAPDNYSSHSPSSIFRKDPKAWKLKLENKTGIATYAKDWSGTHVIGGELIESAAGYRGSLVVLDADGKTVLQKSYPTPMPYFSLMGNMVEDWMDFRQQPYTAAIRAELERPMTTNMQTVRWYGDMFHVVPFSAEDFAIYERILAADPNFAEVRFWYANRKYWAEGWTPQVNTDYARALLSHPVMMAFDAVSPAEIPDENLAEKYVAELARLTLVFPEHVDVIAHTLIQYDFFEKPQYEAEKYLSLAKKYPCSWSIQDGLARYFFAKNQANMYIPLELSAVQSGYVPADDEFRNNYYTAGIGYWTTGHPAAALYCFQKGLAITQGTQARFNLTAAVPLLLRDYLNFPEAMQTAEQLYASAQNKTPLLVNAYMAAYESGKTDIIGRVEPLMTGFSPEERTICDLRKAISTGEYDRAAGIQYQPGIPKSETNPEILGLDYAVTDARELAIARADSMILSGNPQAIPYARYAWTLSPRVPRSAELLKASMLKSRPQEIACYASVMAWLAPELVTYWQGMRQEAIAAGAKPDLEVSALLKKFTTILDDLDEKEEQRMWMTTVPPFLPEYMVMQSLQHPAGDEFTQATSLFTRYAKATRSCSRAYQTHLAAFSAQVAANLPADKAKAWKDAIDSVLF